MFVTAASLVETVERFGRARAAYCQAVRKDVVSGVSRDQMVRSNEVLRKGDAPCSQA